MVLKESGSYVHLVQPLQLLLATIELFLFLLSLIHIFLTFIFIVAGTFTNYGLWGITLAYIAANLIGLVYATLALSKKIIVPNPLFDKAFCKKLVIGGLPFALTSFCLLYTSRCV